jgi:hypothetical protein
VSKSVDEIFMIINILGCDGKITKNKRLGSPVHYDELGAIR